MDVQSIDTVLFDFGGTLDAPGVHWLTRFHKLYPQVGLTIAPERCPADFIFALEVIEGQWRIAMIESSAHCRPSRSPRALRR